MSRKEGSRPQSWTGSVVVLVVAFASTLIVPVQAWLPVAVNPTVAAMIAQVDTDTLLDYASQLSGDTPALIGGQPYTFATRETTSGEPVRKATQFGFESLQKTGLDVRYQAWNACGLVGRNVVAVKTGASIPEEVVLVTAHLDSISEEGAAPGADDNGSGSAAVMAMAGILAPYSFQRTLQFVLFTGEEQGLCGSEYFAEQAQNDQVDIVAVYNMDMIAYDSDHDPILRLHTRPTHHAGYAADAAIANTFIDVVNDYGMQGQLSPQILADGSEMSDTFSFWEAGFPGVLAIEDDGPVSDDFNPYYHSADDTVSAFNLTYYTNFVKASVGTVALLAGVAPAGTPTPEPTPVGPYKLHLPSVAR